MQKGLQCHNYVRVMQGNGNVTVNNHYAFVSDDLMLLLQGCPVKGFASNYIYIYIGGTFLISRGNLANYTINASLEKGFPYISITLPTGKINAAYILI